MMGDRKCRHCSAPLSSDEIALYRKLVFREATAYLCMDCLAGEFDVPRKKLENLVDYYRRTGLCCLFQPYEEGSAIAPEDVGSRPLPARGWA